ncbi:MAG: hypothetical protein NVS3B19_01910 [Ginsengibacter sp.]
MKRTPKRAAVIAVLIIAITIFNFSRIPNSDCVRPIHIVTLIALGLALGVLLTSIMLMIRSRGQQ